VEAGGGSETSTGGYGGGTAGQNVNSVSSGETAIGGNQSTGYQFGLGANGTNAIQSGVGCDGEGGGGCGGGFFGGNTVTRKSGAGTNIPGSGGSGYVNTSLLLSGASTSAGNTTFVSPSGSNETGHAGHGCAKITLIN